MRKLFILALFSTMSLALYGQTSHPILPLGSKAPDFALPGVDPERIEVRLEPNALTVSATRAARLGNPDSIVRRLEIPHGRFVRRIALAGARLRLGESRYVNGCLEVRL